MWSWAKAPGNVSLSRGVAIRGGGRVGGVDRKKGGWRRAMGKGARESMFQSQRQTGYGEDGEQSGNRGGVVELFLLADV